jgi:hypothetical protein
MPPADRRRILMWKAGRRGVKPLLDEEIPAKLFDFHRKPGNLDGSTTNALWAYLYSREYVPDRVHSEIAVEVTLRDVQSLYLREYSGWKSSRLDGGQVYRAPAKGRSESKDASWVLVSFRDLLTRKISDSLRLTHLV